MRFVNQNLKVFVFGFAFVGCCATSPAAQAMTPISQSDLEVRRAIQARDERNLARDREIATQRAREECEHREELERQRLLAKEAEFAAEEARLQKEAEEAALARRVAVTDECIAAIEKATEQGIAKTVKEIAAAEQAAVDHVQAKIDAGHESIARYGAEWARYQLELTATGRAQIKAERDRGAGKKH